MSRTDDSSNKKREVQDVGHEDIMYELLLDDLDAETLMNEDHFEIDTGSQVRLHSVKQEGPVLKDEGKLEVDGKPGTSGEEQVDRCSHHERTVVTTTNKLPSSTVATW